MIEALHELEEGQEVLSVIRLHKHETFGLVAYCICSQPPKQTTNMRTQFEKFLPVKIVPIEVMAAYQARLTEQQNMAFDSMSQIAEGAE